MISLRVLPLNELISTLVAEHIELKRSLESVRVALQGGKHTEAMSELARADLLFKQHIADEEGQILRLFIDTHGREGSTDAIEVFRQHSPIYNLLKSIEAFATLPPHELKAKEGELARLLDEHTAAEESRVFPKALSLI